MLDLVLSFLRLGAADRLRTAARRMGLSLFYAVVAGAAGTGALICVIAAGWLALLPGIGPVWAGSC